MKNNKGPTKTDLEVLDKIQDQDIDYSDIPELTDDFFINATLVEPAPESLAADDPLAHIPDREKWVYENKEVYEKIRRGIEDAEAGRVSYLGSFIQYSNDDSKE